MNVLIVEDEALIALAYADVVERQGFRVAGICASLDDARAASAGARPDLALVDLRLGHKRCGAMVDAYLHDTFGTTAVYITANRDFAYTYRTRAIGFVEKPVSPDGLSSVLRYLAAVHAGVGGVRPPRVLTLFDAGPPMARPLPAGLREARTSV